MSCQKPKTIDNGKGNKYTLSRNKNMKRKVSDNNDESATSNEENNKSNKKNINRKRKGLYQQKHW